MSPVKSTAILLLLVSLLLINAEDFRDRRHHRGHRRGRPNSEEEREAGLTGRETRLKRLKHRGRYEINESDSDSGEDSDSHEDSGSREDSHSSEDGDASTRERSRWSGRRGAPQDDWDVAMIRLDPKQRRRHGNNKPKLARDGAMAARPAAVGGKFALGLPDILPDIEDILPHLRGNVQVGPRFNVHWNLGDLLGLEQEWWKGPNVCQSEFETESGSGADPDLSHHMVITQTSCTNTETAYTCTTEVTTFGNKKTFVNSYVCCHGYQRVPGESGCTQELILTDLVSTAERLNLTQFVEALASVGLDTLLQTGNFTVFVPEDEAFDTIMPTEEIFLDYDMLEITPAVMNFASDLDELLGSHLVEGFHSSPSLEDEMVLSTANSKANIRVNMYEVPTRLMTANCRPVVSKDNLATNGVIHVVSGVLEPVTQSLLERVSKDPDLSTLKTLLAKTGLSSALSELPGQLTLFAPTNAAFQNMDPKKLDRLLTSSTCLTNVVKHHLVDNVICSSVLQSHVRTRNLLQGYLHFNKTGSDITVDDAHMTHLDLMATNGVLHKIDKVLIPDEALDILDVAEKSGATEFVRLISEAALSKTLEMEENITVFVPTNHALQSLPASTLAKLRGDPVALGKVLKYHMVPSVVSGCELRDGKEFETLESSKTLAIKDYSSFPFSMKNVKTIQCAPLNLQTADLKACNGRIHIIDQVLLPPQGDVLDLLSLDSKFSTLVGLLKNSGIAEDLQLTGPYTVFAPTNQAFEKLPQNVLEGLTQDDQQENLRKLLLHHMMPDTLCCSGILESQFFTTPRERMIDGSTVVLTRSTPRRNGESVVTINRVPIASCDLTATNGVVHAIDDLLPEAVQKYTAGHPQHRSRSRMGRIMDSVNSRMRRINMRIDDFEWEFDWPQWMKRGL